MPSAPVVAVTVAPPIVKLTGRPGRATPPLAFVTLALTGTVAPWAPAVAEPLSATAGVMVEPTTTIGAVAVPEVSSWVRVMNGDGVPAEYQAVVAVPSGSTMTAGRPSPGSNLAL